MSKTWDTNYENDIDDDTAGSLIDDNITTLKSEIRKRLETFFDNWANDPDAPTTLDVKDDAILAEHISGLTGTGAVDLDNIPEGSTNKYFSDKTLDDLPDGSTYKKVAGVSGGKITDSSIDNNSISLKKLKAGTYTDGSINIAKDAEWTPPAGFVYWAVASATSANVYLKVYINGAWRVVTWILEGSSTYTPDGGFFFSDGSNMRLHNSSADSVTIYYKVYE